MSLAAIVSKKNPIVFTFSYRIALISPCPLKVKANPGSSFEQTMMGRGPQCYIPSFVEIGRPVPEKKILKGFYHI